MGELQQIIDAIQKGTAGFLGLLCFLVFLANAVLLAWLVMKKGSSTLARCPKCGRTIACPHCQDEEEHDLDDGSEAIDEM